MLEWHFIPTTHLWETGPACDTPLQLPVNKLQALSGSAAGVRSTIWAVYMIAMVCLPWLLALLTVLLLGVTCCDMLVLDAANGLQPAH